MKLSIIVPVYNTEKYLKKCIDSLIQQDYDSYEIIIINDGSTDESGNICEYYKRHFPNLIKCYKKNNSGLSDTRNYGIKKAVGDYVMFIDSDDYLDVNSISGLMTITDERKPDIVYFGYYLEKGESLIKKYTNISKKDSYYKSEDLLRNELRHRNLSIPACFAIYKKDMLLENGLFFESGILHEDERWSPIVLLKSKAVYMSSSVIYHYVQRDESITHKSDRSKNGLDLIKTCTYLDAVADNIEDETIRRLLKNRIAMVYMKSIIIGNLTGNIVDKKFPIRRACIAKDRLKAIIFMLSINMYKKVYGAMRFGND